MSGFVVMVPVIVGWPAFVAAATVAGIAYGMSRVGSDQMTEVNSECEAEIPLSSNYALADTIDEGESVCFQGNGFSVVFEKTGRGDCQMRVNGVNKSEAELEFLGKNLLNGIAQQYAYQKITAEMKRKGFAVTKEEVSEDKTIRLTVSRWK
ncbi:MAG: DUF1257 domain-containing protein [Candidatus Riflebacteria bacterium]|nr:DUF1257 domain-containing protein [Candidatus Riflebacteria bacterium]